MKKKIVAVTGGTGHLGNNIVRILLQAKYSVRVLLFPGCNIGEVSLKDLDVQIFLGDVFIKETLHDFLKGADFVVHLAGIISIDGDKGGKVYDVNVQGTANVCDVALKMNVTRLIHMSTIHVFDFLVYGKPISEKTISSSLDIHGHYAHSKRMGEKEVRKRVEKGLNAIILNPTGIIGPFDYEPSRMGRFFLDIFYGRLPSIVCGGFHWIDIRDVSRAVLSGFEKGKINESYIISNNFYSIRQLYEISHEITGLKIPLMESPLGLAYLGIPFAKLVSLILGNEPLITEESLDTLRTNMEIDYTKAKDGLDFNPRPIEETIKDIYFWFIKKHFIDIEKEKGLKREKLEKLMESKSFKK
jgi:dihydroflavonol-4-reductase